MKQAALDLNFSLKKTRKREFLAQMNQVVPWAALVELITPYYPEAHTGRPPFALETMAARSFSPAVVWPFGPGDGGSLL